MDKLRQKNIKFKPAATFRLAHPEPHFALIPAPVVVVPATPLSFTASLQLQEERPNLLRLPAVPIITPCVPLCGDDAYRQVSSALRSMLNSECGLAAPSANRAFFSNKGGRNPLVQLTRKRIQSFHWAALLSVGGTQIACAASSEERGLF